MTDETLLLCPFCGGKAGAYTLAGKRWTVECAMDDCRAELPDAGETAAQAIAAWNRRAPAERAAARP